MAHPTDDSTFHYPLRVSNAVYALGGFVNSLPKPLANFPLIAETEGVAFLFKPFGMDQLYRLLACHRPILLRRPFGWGIEMFMTTFAARVAISPFVPFDTFYVDECTIDSGVGLHEDTILPLDFGGVNLSGVDVEADVAAALTGYVHRRCQQYAEHYAIRDILPIECFLASKSPAAQIISYTIVRPLTSGMMIDRTNSPIDCTSQGQSHCKQLPVILLIENFDAIQTSEAERVLNAFFHRLEDMVVTGHMKALILFSDMDDDENLRVPNLQHTVDVTHHPAFQTAVGCAERDVRDLDRALAKSFPEARGDIFQLLKYKNFSPVVFTDPEWDKELPPSHPLRAAKLRLSEGNRGVYPLEPVMEVLTEKYSLEQP
ncbi:hypothetical protein FB45DRAFT_915510 [Roridomyces roridus]|uniref:Uncharacterized protein n=1 Tax=Roridomyces roridus TaxID=1738132 RepID=A0AAD7BTE8_9AGAR|nr:hypothetical protein FB45DRAFT_915510 [Roridomyces roridus]